jgi:uncharacterized membrane protein YqjE
MIQQASEGLFASLHRLADTGLAAAKTRLELFSVEIREERARFLEILSWATIAVFMGMMAVIALTATVLLLSSPAARPYVAVGFTLLYLAGAIGAGVNLRGRLRKRAMPFTETISQLHKDRLWLDSLS